MARWSNLYHFVEVDVRKSEKELLARFKAGSRPSFTVVDGDLNVIATSPLLSSSKKVVGFLRSTVTSKLSDYWSEVETRLDEQKTAIREASALERKKDLQAALDKLREVTLSQLRVGEFWEDALKDSKRLERKLADD